MGGGRSALERERGDTGRYERLLEQVEIVTDELRRRVGQTYSLGELALVYRDAERWRARPSRIVRLRPAGRAISRSSWPPRSSPTSVAPWTTSHEPRPRRRRRRASARFVLVAVAAALILFAVGVALGEALQDNPKPDLTVTTTETLVP